MSECQHVFKNKCKLVLRVPCTFSASAYAPNGLWNMNAGTWGLVWVCKGPIVSTVSGWPENSWDGLSREGVAEWLCRPQFLRCNPSHGCIRAMWLVQPVITKGPGPSGHSNPKRCSDFVKSPRKGRWEFGELSTCSHVLESFYEGMLADELLKCPANSGLCVQEMPPLTEISLS